MPKYRHSQYFRQHVLYKYKIKKSDELIHEAA